MELLVGELLESYQTRPRAFHGLLERRPAIDSTSVALDALAKLEPGTLGHEYERFMIARGLSLDAVHAPERSRDPDVAYLTQRLRQTHDLLHVVTGAATDNVGEVILQAFTYGQTGLSLSLIIAFAGTVGLFGRRRGIVRNVHHAYRLGKSARPLMMFPWEAHWTTPLAEVRKLLKITETLAS